MVHSVKPTFPLVSSFVVNRFNHLRNNVWHSASRNVRVISTGRTSEPYVRASKTVHTYGRQKWRPYVKNDARTYVRTTRTYGSSAPALNWQQKCLWWDKIKIAARRNCVASFNNMSQANNMSNCLRPDEAENVHVASHVDYRYERSINTLVREVHMEDESEFRSMFRMNAENLQFLLDLVGPAIAKHDTLMRESVSARERSLYSVRTLGPYIRQLGAHDPYRT